MSNPFGTFPGLRNAWSLFAVLGLKIIAAVAVTALMGGGASLIMAEDACPDSDGDLWGQAVEGCDASGLHGVGDCNDNDASVNPGAAEVCEDGIDNDCDGEIDFGLRENDFEPTIPNDAGSGTCFISDPPECSFVGDPAEPPQEGCCRTEGHKICNADKTGIVCGSDAPGGSITVQEREGPAGDLSCFDGFDQDCDGHTDVADPDCQWSTVQAEMDSAEMDSAEMDSDDPTSSDGGSPETGGSYVYGSSAVVNMDADPCPDADGDLWGVFVAGCDAAGLLGFGDCNDGDPNVNPGAAEICGDSIDNDCDGEIDFGLLQNNFEPPFPGTGPTGSCFLSDPSGCVFVGDPPLPEPGGCCLTGGHKECNTDLTGIFCMANNPDGTFRMLEIEGPPGDPSCFDGSDQDCDALHDHEDPDCQTDEVCNGFDDDNNGLIDETFDLDLPCTVGTGTCERTGVTVCDTSGGLRCSGSPRNPKSEAEPGKRACADGVDNDCDGLIDLNDPDCLIGELCDSEDNNGDGLVDEIFVDLNQPCSAGTGACASDGIFVCTADGGGTICNATLNLDEAGTEGPSGETCEDGVDNDCDGLIDGADSGCGSAEISAACALLPLLNTPNGASCNGHYRVHFEVSGDGPDSEIFAELLAISPEGEMIGVIPVENGEAVHLRSRLDPQDWKMLSRPNRRGGGELAGPGDWHFASAPIPLLRVRVKDSMNEAVAYCSPVPYLDVVRPDNTIADGTNEAATIDVLAALPLMNAGSLAVSVNGVDIFAELLIDPAVVFPGSHPGGEVKIDGKTVTISDIVVDIAPSIGILSSNTLSMNIEGLACGGSEVVVEGEGHFPFGTRTPVAESCHVDDLHDCGAVSVFELRIDSPTTGQITDVVPTPVQGEVCHGLEIVQTSINGKQLDTMVGQMFTPSGGECSGGTYQFPIDTTLEQTNMFAKAAGVNPGLGTFDPGSNRLIASATDEEAHRVFKKFIFAVGGPGDIILSSTLVQQQPEAISQPLGSVSTKLTDGLEWDFDYSQTAEGLAVSGTAIVDAFVLGLGTEAMDAFFAAACADPETCIKEDFQEAVCSINTTDKLDSPCCDPTIRFQTIGCADGDGIPNPGFLGDFTCEITAMDGAGPNGTGGKIVVSIGIPRIQYNLSIKGDCHGGFLWGCNTDVNLQVQATWPHPGDPGCSAGDPNVCSPLNMQPDDNEDGVPDCCIPTQPLNRVDIEIEERDIGAAEPLACACEEGDADCEAACCDNADPGCILGTITTSGIPKGVVTAGKVSVGGWNVVLLGFILLGVGFLLLGPIGALVGGVISIVLFTAILPGGTFSINATGFNLVNAGVEEAQISQFTVAIGDVSPDSDPYEAEGLEIDIEFTGVKINAEGLTATADLGLTVTVPDPVEDSIGFLATTADPPMPPLDAGNLFVAFPDDLLNGIFAAATQSGLLTSETCGGTLASGACCSDANFEEVRDLFPDPGTCPIASDVLCCDHPDFMGDDVFLNAAIVGVCLGIHAGDLVESEATDLCESFFAPTALERRIGQGTCHGVRGANCSQIPNPLLSIFRLESRICELVPPLNIRASDPVLLCARTGIEPRFLITDDEDTPQIESRLLLNDLLVSVLVDRADDGYNLDELQTIAACWENNDRTGDMNDCSIVGVCLDFNITASMELVQGAAGPEIATILGEALPNAEGEVCDGTTQLRYNYDEETTQGAAESDPLTENLIDNAAAAIPVQAPENIELGGLVMFQSPELFAIKTSTDPGRCINDLENPTGCVDDGDCGGDECIHFQDYFGVRGTIVADIPAAGVCEVP